MALLLIRNALGLIAALGGLQLGAVHLELVGVDYEVSEAVFFIDLRLDGDGALVGEATAEFDVMDREVIMRRLGPSIEVRKLVGTAWVDGF